MESTLYRRQYARFATTDVRARAPFSRILQLGRLRFLESIAKSRSPCILIRVLLSFPPVRFFPLTFFVLLFLYRYSLPFRKVEKSSSLPLVPAGLRYTFASSCLGRIIQSTFSSHDDRISLSLSGHVYPDRASADPFQFQSLSDS